MLIPALALGLLDPAAHAANGDLNQGYGIKAGGLCVACCWKF